MLKRYRIRIYLKERIYMTLREIVTAAHDEFKAVADSGRFMAMSETPMDVQGMLDQEGDRDAGFITGDCEQQTCILNLPAMQ